MEGSIFIWFNSSYYEFLGNLGYVIVAIIGGYLTTKGKLEIGYILSFSQYVRNFNTPIMSIAQIFSLIQSMVASSERVFEFWMLQKRLMEQKR